MTPRAKSPTWTPFKGGKKAPTYTPKPGESPNKQQIDQLKKGTKSK